MLRAKEKTTGGNHINENENNSKDIRRFILNNQAPASYEYFFGTKRMLGYQFLDGLSKIKQSNSHLKQILHQT